MKKTALVIMAAGVGSRFGNGIKQLAPVGPNGEIIMDYSIRDALEAGFNKIVFIIRKDLEEEFKSTIGARVEKIAEVAYAYQEMEKLPEGFVKPADRTKPWGTGHAVICAREFLTEPFAVINADDYYGKEAYVKVHDYLVQEQPAEKLDLNELVSMNMWGLTPAFMDTLYDGFVEFLQNVQAGDIKAEYLLPVMIDTLIQKGTAQVDVLETKDTWFGVTYQEDKEVVIKAFKELTEAGVYPNGLYK